MMFGYSKEAVRVKVKKCEGKLQPELRKFSVDPQITSLEVLQSILVKAFDIKSDFTLSYRSVDDYGQEIHLPLLSDWDLDAAFLKAHNIAVTQKSEPCVQLKVDMKPFAEASEDWEPPNVTQTTPIVNQNHNHKEQPTVAPQAEKQEPQTGFQGLIMNQVEKTFNMVSRALNLYEETGTPRPPLADHEFRAFLDPTGLITDTARLREVIYCGGIDPSLRKVVWKHILNVYPDGMTGKERMDYIKRKANEYYTLRARWKDCIQKGMVNPDLAYVTGMVRKDVLRTDRHHTFYAGSDDNQNIASLFNILTTYALNHPRVSYCQGMSDLASPLLVTMGDEAHAYICLCALMCRLQPNFLLDGEAMTLKFAHLAESLQVYDADFYAYLKSQQADDLLFCYRWLLLEMKREFAFEDALRMLEVLWASLPPAAPAADLPLREPAPPQPAPPQPAAAPAPRENAYTKLCAIRRQSSSFSLAAPAERPPAPRLRRARDFRSLDDAALQRAPEPRDAAHAGLERRRAMRSLPEHERAPAWASTGDLANGDPRGAPLGCQVRLLRDRISLHNDKFSCSLDGLAPAPVAAPDARPKVKMIKNLNEFLNFATGGKAGAGPPERLQRARSVIERGAERPRITPGAASDERPPRPARADDGSSPDDSQEYYPMTTSMTRELRLELEHLDRQVFGNSFVNRRSAAGRSPSDSGAEPAEARAAARSAEDVFLWENPLHRAAPARAASCPQTPDEQAELDYDGDTGEIFEEHSGKKSVTPIRLLRKPRPPAPARPAPARDADSDSSEREPDARPGGPDARPGGPDARPGGPDARPGGPDARPGGPDARPGGPDARPGGPDARPGGPDARPGGPDARPGDPDARPERPDPSATRSQKFFSSMSQELENAKRNCESLLNTKQPNLHSVASTITSFQKKYEALKPAAAARGGEPRGAGGARGAGALPPPAAFGGGNPFLMFLCLTVLLQHRDYIMRNRMDYNELAMHFDKMVRKHNVTRVLHQARHMYALYLKQHAPAPASAPAPAELAT